jgi:hypothetical protein
MRRNGTRKFGPLLSGTRPWSWFSPGPGEQDVDEPGAASGAAGERAARHAAPSRPFPVRLAARKRARKVVPAAVIAATLAAGATAYGLVATSGSASGSLTADVLAPSGNASASGTHPGLPDAASARPQSPAPAAGQATKQAVKPTATAPSKPAQPKPPASRPVAQASVVTAPEPTRQVAPVAAAPVATHPAAPVSATTVSCGSSGLLPANVTAIVSFLVGHGYSGNAAAGIAGNIYQESKGNPESEGMGGGGLIGWTPLPAGYVTGSYSADLQTQLAGIVTFNQIWSSYIPALNGASSPAAAADIYVTDFERAGIPAAGTRESAAQDVAAACGL